MSKIFLRSNDELETIKLGQKIASILKDGSVVCLYGNLGVGKTTFVRGIAKGLNITENVQSPTFNIMKIYFKGNRPLVHIDAYRLEDMNTDIGLDEYIGIENGLTLIEWPMYIDKLIPSEAVKITISRVDDSTRTFEIETNDEDLLEKLK